MEPERIEPFNKQNNITTVVSELPLKSGHIWKIFGNMY